MNFGILIPLWHPPPPGISSWLRPDVTLLESMPPVKPKACSAKEGMLLRGHPPDVVHLERTGWMIT